MDGPSSEAVRDNSGNSASGAGSQFDFPQELARYYPDLSEFACEKTMVIVQDRRDDRLAIIGALAEISPFRIVFSYLVIDKTLGNKIDSIVKVLLKDDGLTSPPMECVVLSDSDFPEGSFFDLPMRKCVLGLSW